MPAASAAYDALPLPFPPGQGRSLTLMKPVAEQRSLTVAWCVPVTDFDQWASTKPDVVWRLLLQTRVDGGLAKAGPSLQPYVREAATLPREAGCNPM